MSPLTRLKNWMYESDAEYDARHMRIAAQALEGHDKLARDNVSMRLVLRQASLILSSSDHNSATVKAASIYVLKEIDA